MKKDFPYENQNPTSLCEKWGSDIQSMAPSIRVYSFKGKLTAKPVSSQGLAKIRG